MSGSETTALQTLFPTEEWPTFVSIEELDNTITLDLLVTPSIRWFEGHFPEQPVLAGVVQTHWAGELGKHFFELGDAFKGLDNLKFHAVILPDQHLKLELRFDPEKKSLAFSYKDADTTYSEGKFRFSHEAK